MHGTGRSMSISIWTGWKWMGIGWGQDMLISNECPQCWHTVTLEMRWDGIARPCLSVGLLGGTYTHTFTFIELQNTFTTTMWGCSSYICYPCPPHYHAQTNLVFIFLPSSGISICGLNVTRMWMDAVSFLNWAAEPPRYVFMEDYRMQFASFHSRVIVWAVCHSSTPAQNCHPEYLRGYSFQALHGPEYIGSLTSSKYLQKAHPQRLFLFEPIIQGSSRSINKWRPIRASRSKYNVR